MGKVVGMDAAPKKADTEGAVKKENTALKKAYEKLSKENEGLIEKLNEASDYAENADKTIEQLTARVAELEAAAEGGKD